MAYSALNGRAQPLSNVRTGDGGEDGRQRYDRVLKFILPSTFLAREGGTTVEPTEPITREVTREQQLSRWHDHLAQFRMLIDNHTQLAQRLLDLHERHRVLQSDPSMGAEERRAQTTEIVRAEGEVPKQAQHVQQALQHLLRENHRLLR
jgi:hypothetical protein